ncbi:MAG TPA: hypothetical protein VEI52_05045, partial [Terriglobales bacterium]|nr:hypothetical protein [Terriglobales bacterium]
SVCRSLSLDRERLGTVVQPGGLRKCAARSIRYPSPGQYFNPGYGDIDFSALKNTPITESVTLQLRAEFFNLFNRTNLAPVGAPTAEIGSGQITSTIGVFYAAPAFGPGEPFNTQLSAKIIF